MAGEWNSGHLLWTIVYHGYTYDWAGDSIRVNPTFGLGPRVVSDQQTSGSALESGRPA